MKQVYITSMEVHMLMQAINFAVDSKGLTVDNFLTDEAKALYYKCRSVKDESEYQMILGDVK